MKKFLSIGLGVVMTLSMGLMAACSQNSNDGDDNKGNSKKLIIEVSSAGFGEKWIDPLIDMFENEHPGVKVKKIPLVKQDNTMVEKVISGASESDLFFVETQMPLQNVDKPITSNGTRYDSPFEELSDILNSPIPGEDIIMKDKMESSFYSLETAFVSGEEKHYFTPWMQGPLGIVINMNLYSEDKYGKLPNTTNEFLTFCETIKNKGATPFIYDLLTSYWDSLYDCWFAQYLGKEDFVLWNQGYDVASGETKEDMDRYVPEMFLNEGLLYSFETLEKILNKENDYASEYSYTLPDFTSIQNKYLEGKDNILMMPTGAWLEREMESNYTPEELNLKFIPFPVISELGDKLGITDNELSNIIDYTKGRTTTKPEFTSKKGFSNEEVINRVDEAARLVPSYHHYHSFIPAYSDKIDLSKEFLQLMASDRGIEAMLNECGSSAPYKYDIDKSSIKDNLSPFIKEVNNMARQDGYYFTQQDPLFIKGGLFYVNGNEATTSLSVKFSADKGDGKVSAKEVFDNSYLYVSTTWDSILQSAGLSQ